MGRAVSRGEGKKGVLLSRKTKDRILGIDAPSKEIRPQLQQSCPWRRERFLSIRREESRHSGLCGGGEGLSAFRGGDKAGFSFQGGIL